MNQTNPFSLMFGRPPQTIISRSKVSADIIQGFDSVTPVFQTCLISGVRGSGKTVLMTSVSRQLKETSSNSKPAG